MVKKTDDDVELRLIDYDSLVLVTTCDGIPMNKQTFHVRHDVIHSKVTALDFLWWQCVLFGSTWLGRTALKSVNSEKFVSDWQGGAIKVYFPDLNDDDASFLNEISLGRKVEVEDIEGTLDCLAKAFCRTSSRKRVFPSSN